MTDSETEWEDWYLPPVVGSKFAFDTTPVDTYPTSVVIIDSGNLNAATVWLQWISPTAGEKVRIGIYYGVYVGGEATQFFTETFFTILMGATHVIPITATAPKFYLYVDEFTGSGGELEWRYISRSGAVETLALTGASPSAQGTETVTAAGSTFVFPYRQVPGKVAIHFATTATDWDLYLRVFDVIGDTDVLIADESNPLAVGATIIVPASTWCLVYTNNDGVDRDVSYSLIYEQ